VLLEIYESFRKENVSTLPADGDPVAVSVVTATAALTDDLTQVSAAPQTPGATDGTTPARKAPARKATGRTKAGSRTFPPTGEDTAG
jgi:hypothetical protein